jgi:hypothetical protein
MRIQHKCIVVVSLLILSLGVMIYARYQETSMPLLKYHLGETYSEDILDLRTKRIGGIDSRVYIYVHASSSVIKRIISRGNFKEGGAKYSESQIEWVKNLTPDEDVSGLRFYEKDTSEHTYFKYIAVDNTGTKLWYFMSDY